MAEPATVQVDTQWTVVAPDGEPHPVEVSLRYLQAEPYAVHVLFYDDGEVVPWWFARDLLAAGLDEVAGAGDVRVWPLTTSGGDFVAVTLSSPDGNALFHAPRDHVARFVAHSYMQVPAGRESDHVDVDTAIARLLAPRPRRW